jgi:pimeloyl-ACP methyl ester carboxylesterase
MVPDFQRQLAAYPLQHAQGDGWRVHYRCSGRAAAATHVLLHGIGSASANWILQLEQVQASTAHKVLVWDAPGYGDSTALTQDRPLALDYAKRLWQWLDTVGVSQPVVLAGHSLGALMASAAAALRPYAVQQLVLLAPARGYANVSPEEREKIRLGRIGNVRNLGPSGMAAARCAAMLSPSASAEQIAYVRECMEKINPAGYEQAVHLLADADLFALLDSVTMPVHVGSGSQDTITSEPACRAVAAKARVAWQDLGPVGHACALEAPDAVNRILGLNQMPTANNKEVL